MRRADEVVELEQRVVGRHRLLLEDVERRASEVARGQGVGQRLLVDVNAGDGCSPEECRTDGEGLLVRRFLSRRLIPWAEIESARTATSRLGSTVLCLKTASMPFPGTAINLPR